MDADGFLSRPPAHPCPLPVPPEFSVASSLCPGRETPEARDLLAILCPASNHQVPCLPSQSLFSLPCPFFLAIYPCSAFLIPCPSYCLVGLPILILTPRFNEHTIVK